MAISFKTDIVPLFRSVDIEHMSRLEVPLDDLRIHEPAR